MSMSAARGMVQLLSHMRDAGKTIFFVVIDQARLLAQTADELSGCTQAMIDSAVTSSILRRAMKRLRDRPQAPNREPRSLGYFGQDLVVMAQQDASLDDLLRAARRSRFSSRSIPQATMHAASAGGLDLGGVFIRGCVALNHLGARDS